MASYRFPILVWQDFQGSCTAALVEDESNVAAVGATAAEAVERLAEYLRWLYRKQPWLAAPDFVEPVLSYARVEVRPEYKAREKSFPVHEGAGAAGGVRGREGPHRDAALRDADAGNPVQLLGRCGAEGAGAATTCSTRWRGRRRGS